MTSVAVTTQLWVCPVSKVVTYSKALPYSIFFVIAWDTCRQRAKDYEVVYFACMGNLEGRQRQGLRSELLRPCCESSTCNCRVRERVQAVYINMLRHLATKLSPRVPTTCC